MTRLIIWRHGQTAWNAAHRVQGGTDVDLSRLGRDQAAMTAPDLAGLRPAAIVSSDLRRAADTAAVLAGLTGLEVALDPRLRERGYGEWEGLTGAEMRRRWPKAYLRWRSGEPVGAAGVEENGDVDTRVIAALQDAVALAPGRTVVVVCHGGVARRGIGALLGWPDVATRSLGGLANCHWADLLLTRLRGWVLLGYNLGSLAGVDTFPDAGILAGTMAPSTASE